MKSLKMDFQSKDSQDIIHIESNAFAQLIKETITHLEKERMFSIKSVWIHASEAKRLLGVSSNGTLQKLRDEGKVRYSRPTHKIILYDRNSINEFIESHSQNTF